MCSSGFKNTAAGIASPLTSIGMLINQQKKRKQSGENDRANQARMAADAEALRKENIRKYGEGISYQLLNGR